MRGLTRRELLAAGVATSVTLSLHRLLPASSAAPAAAPRAGPSYRDFRDLYRRSWRFDRVVRGTHLRANCFSACSFDLYVKDGVVWREEQADVYARKGAPGRSDFAPRGCQKGACYSDLMVGADRVTHPLERAGPRGSGRWRRVTWDHALRRLADAMVDAIEEGGEQTVVFDNGTSNVDDGPSSLGEMRLFSLLGATLLDGFGGTGDLAMGAVQTWGTTFVDGSTDDWMRADTLVVWHCNPVATRIPDAHFLNEARYRGTHLAVVSPDYSPTATKASLWVNPHAGSDAALALGLAREVLERDAVDWDYVREQTDLPFLVREDDGRFLRESDLDPEGSPEVFYVHDEATGRITRSPGSAGRFRDSIALGDLRPATSGRFAVETLAGTVRVRPVLELLRERLSGYGPEEVAARTGVASGVQAALADAVCGARRVLFYPSWGSNKSYHADLLQRSLILVSALRGQQGRAGGGVRFSAWLPLEGGAALVPGPRSPWWQRQLLRVWTPPPRTMEAGIAAASRDVLTWTPSHLFLHTHAGLDRLQDADARDDDLPRTPRAYLDEAVARGFTRVLPPADRPPRVLVTSGVNPLRRWPAPAVVERVLWPKLRMVATIDFRMSTTATKADLFLPAAGYYEKRGIKYAMALLPYLVVGDQAVAPLGESRGEWQIMVELARHVQERARARGVAGAAATLHDHFTEQGRLGPESDVMLLDRILRGSKATAGIGWEEARRAGAIPLRSAGGWGTTSGIGSELEPGGTLTPSRIHVEERHAWPTLTGRQQFYLDHPWFQEADEALPRWKPPPRPGGDHPIRLSGGHTRWSIHAIWRAHPDLLRLQRGQPVLWMSDRDARERGIADNQRVRVWNDHGEFRILAKPTPALAPGLAIVYHAWEPYQFPGRRGNMEVVSSPYKPLHLVGDYGHLRYRVFFAGPVHVPRGVPVEIALAADASGAVGYRSSGPAAMAAVDRWRLAR